MWCGNYFETGHVETIARYTFTIPIKTEHFILPIKLSTLIVFLISQRLVQICSNKPSISTILLWAIFIRCWTQTKTKTNTKTQTKTNTKTQTKTNRKCFKYSFGKHVIQGLQMWYLHDEEKDAQTKMCLKHPVYAIFLKSSRMKIRLSPKLYVKVSINFSAQNVPPKTSDQYILLAVKWRIRKVYLVEFDFCGQDNMHHAVSWHTELLLRHSWQMTEGSPRHVAWYSG